MGAEKWEDTVMTEEVLLQVMGKSPSGYARLLTATRVQAEVSFKAGEKAKEEALKATGKYCRLHRTVQPEGYKQPIRAPGWKVFIPDTKEVSND